MHLTVEALCRRDSNLLTADADLKILLRELLEKKSKFASKMTDAVDNEILEDTEIMLSEFSTKRQSDNRTYKEKLEEKTEKKHVK